MSINIYVGNLPFDSNETEIKELFERYGAVEYAKIISGQFADRTPAFGFIEMRAREEGLKAIQELNYKDFHGRSLRVNEARPRVERNTVHVISRTGKWAVKREGAARALRVFSKKEDAIDFATQLLENSSAREIVVHEKDGTVAGKRRSGQREQTA